MVSSDRIKTPVPNVDGDPIPAITKYGVYAVTVERFPPFHLSARSRSAAMYEAFQRYRDPWPCTFAEFLKIARVNSCPVPANDGYNYIRQGYGVPVAVGARVTITGEGPHWSGRRGTVVYPGQSTTYVRVVMDGSNRISNFHPFSVILLSDGALGHHAQTDRDKSRDEHDPTTIDLQEGR